MTIHLDPQSATGYPAAARRRFRARRLAAPVGLASVAAVVVVGLAHINDDTHHEVRSPAVDYTRAQVLVQQSIDDALDANRAGASPASHGPVWQSSNHSVRASMTPPDATRAQTLIQQSIDDALAANHSIDDLEFTRAQTLVQQSIDEVLAARG